jgi:hypothetical protein
MNYAERRYKKYAYYYRIGVVRNLKEEERNGYYK